ncbi:MAG: NUDIX domain-containing protein [Pseudobdellovibrionaceae bacterium]
MQIILDQIESILPWDSTEDFHLRDCVEWIQSGAPIFRIKKPDVPNQHLVSYSALIDPHEKEILLVEHKNAELWLPCGGHVELNEDPKISAQRELAEELNILPVLLFEKPIFITKAVTVGHTAGHTDVSLWYIFKGERKIPLNFDKNEFHSVRWFHFDEIPLEKSDPNMARFIAKLKHFLENNDEWSH